MINENIRKYRKKKGISQEELAVRLHVVRQTISKWEKGLSVPDADILIHMAELLEVPVSKLLGVEVDAKELDELTEELARLNKELAIHKQKESLATRVNNKRNLILFLSFSAMLTALIVKNEIASVILVGACILAAVGILYQNLALLTSVTTDDLRIRTLKITTIFNIVVLLIGIVSSVLIGLDIVTVSQNEEKVFAMLLISCVMVFGGIVSPKLPFSRHTGLRLPWTVRDEETWNLAHQIMGYISLPLVLLYLAGTWTISNFEMVTGIVMLAWIGIPGFISYIFFWKKMHGKV